MNARLLGFSVHLCSSHAAAQSIIQQGDMKSLRMYIVKELHRRQLSVLYFRRRVRGEGRLCSLCCVDSTSCLESVRINCLFWFQFMSWPKTTWAPVPGRCFWSSSQGRGLYLGLSFALAGPPLGLSCPCPGKAIDKFLWNPRKVLTKRIKL